MAQSTFAITDEAPPKAPTFAVTDEGPAQPLAGPTHTAARRNAMAQPGITPEARTAALPGDKPAWDSPENPQLGNPEGTLPIGKEMSTAGTLAGIVAGVGEGNMGLPSPAKVTPWSTLKGYGRKILGLPEGEGAGGWTPQQAAPLNRQLPAAKEPLVTPPPADRSGPIPPEERIDLGRGGYPEPKPAAPPQAKPLTGSTSQQVDQLVNTAYGVKPLEKGVPLRSQIETKGYGAQYSARGNAPETAGATQEAAKPLTPTAQPNAPETPPKAQPMSLAEKYPDKAVRQMVHANGEKIVNAVGDDPETMQALHSLTAVDLRQALINSGEDVGQRPITSSKFEGPGAITRQQAFERLLEKGHSPQDIVSLAKPPEAAPAVAPVLKQGRVTPDSIKAMDDPQAVRNLIDDASQPDKIRKAALTRWNQIGPHRLSAAESPAPKAEAQPETAAPELKARSAYSPHDVERGEAEMRGALELGDYLPRPGRYFDEYAEGEHSLAGRYNTSAGERPAGRWRGVGAQKPNISGQYPWFSDEGINLSRVQRALHKQGGADWRYVMDKIAKTYEEPAPF